MAQQTTNVVNLGLSASLQPLFEPKRFKVMHGGRAAGRSWGVARVLLMLARTRNIRVLCVREFQKSIEESVYAVLEDQANRLGIWDEFVFQHNKIFHKATGSQFFFEGIKNNPQKIKSYEGIDYCWVEEAAKVSMASWNILEPTIRKETPDNWRELGLEKPEWQSEIWLTFNPELEQDYIYKFFIKNKRLRPCTKFLNDDGSTVAGIRESEDSFTIKMTYKNNPWLPQVTERAIARMQEDDPDLFDNIYDGNPVTHLEGVVYAKQLRALEPEGRLLEVPWEPEVPVDTFWDLGRADHTCIWFGQYVGMQFRVIDFLDGRGEDITFYLKALQEKPYVYGTMFLPHDAKHKKLVYKHSIEEQVRAKFKDTKVMPALGVADGINNARLFFRKCWFDEAKTADGLAALRRYKYKIKDGQGTAHPTYSDVPEHGDDGSSDAADAFEIMAQAAGTGGHGARARVKVRLEESQAGLAHKAKLRLGDGLAAARSALGWMN